VFLLASPALAASCVNKYVAQKGSNNNKLTMTLLTGMLTFTDAKALAAAIEAGDHAPLSWVTDDGKVIAQQIGELKVVRPMPVSCEGKSSGVVVQASFLAVRTPGKIVKIVFDPDKTIAFESQND
jgi:hypothetical protein